MSSPKQKRARVTRPIPFSFSFLVSFSEGAKYQRSGYSAGKVPESDSQANKGRIILRRTIAQISPAPTHFERAEETTLSQIIPNCIGRILVISSITKSCRNITIHISSVTAHFRNHALCHVGSDNVSITCGATTCCKRQRMGFAFLCLCYAFACLVFFALLKD